MPGQGGVRARRSPTLTEERAAWDAMALTVAAGQALFCALTSSWKGGIPLFTGKETGTQNKELAQVEPRLAFVSVVPEIK